MLIAGGTALVGLAVVCTHDGVADFVISSDDVSHALPPALQNYHCVVNNNQAKFAYDKFRNKRTRPAGSHPTVTVPSDSSTPTILTTSPSTSDPSTTRRGSVTAKLTTVVLVTCAHFVDQECCCTYDSRIVNRCMHF